MIYEKGEQKKLKVSLCLSEENFDKVAQIAIDSDYSYSYVVNYILKKYFKDIEESE